MQTPGRISSTTSYRYGFNGKENDNEVKGAGNQQDYGMRIYDPRLGKFLSVDPLQKKYPGLTPYQFASNTPIQAIDLDGLEGIRFSDVWYGRANIIDWLNDDTPDGAVGTFNRNINPVGIVATNGYSVVTGRDFDTGEKTSRAGAAINIFALYVFHKATVRPLSAPQQLEKQLTTNAANLNGAKALATAEQQEGKAIIKQAQANGGEAEANAATSVNRGRTTALEKVNNSAAQDFESSATGAASDLKSKYRSVPALKYDNPNPRGANIIKFDGFDDFTDTFIDRKLNVTGFPKSIDQINRAAEALSQNPQFKLVYQVPSNRVNAMQSALRKAGQLNNPQISVQAVKPN